MEVVRRGDWTFRVDDRGPADAEAIVLRHGFPGEPRTWDAVARRLVAEGFRTLAPEQRGYGDGARPTRVEGYVLPELAADVLALADRADLDRIHVVGHDWGGFVAWYLAAHHRERVRSVAVLSTPHPRALAASLPRGTQLLRSWYALWFQLPALPEQTLLVADGWPLRRALVASGLPTATADRYVTSMCRPGALTGALDWYRAAFRHPTHLRSVGRIDVPVLYVWSTGDVALGRDAAERTGRQVGGPYRFVVLDDVSHWLPETEPAQVAQLVIEHLRTTAAR